MAKSPYGGRSGGYGGGRGVGSASEEMLRLKNSIEEAIDAAKGQKKALEDVDYEKAAAKLDRLTRANNDLARAQQRQWEIASRTKAVNSGRYANEVKAAREYQNEIRKIEVLERRAALQSQYGRRLGGAVAAAERMGQSGAGRFAHGMTASAVATGTGLAMSGFQNTAELNRFNAQLSLVAREMGNVFKPALDGAAAGMGKLARYMQGLSGRQQDTLMYGGLAAAGGLAASSAARRLGYSGLAEAGASGLAAARGLGPGGLARGAGALAIVGGSIYATQRQGGGYGLQQRTIDHYGQDRDADYYDRMGHEFRKGETFLGRVKGQIGEYTLGWAQDAMGIKRNDHRSMSVQAFEIANQKRAEKAANDHRNLNLAGGGFEAIGSGYGRLASAFGALDDKGDRPEVAFLKRIAENTEPKPNAPPSPR